METRPPGYGMFHVEHNIKRRLERYFRMLKCQPGPVTYHGNGTATMITKNRKLLIKLQANGMIETRPTEGWRCV